MANPNQQLLRKILQTRQERDLDESNSVVTSALNPESRAIVAHQQIDQSELDQFKKIVELWRAEEVAVKRLQHATKEHKKKKLVYEEQILKFMQHYSIEDLNTKDGIIRYKTTYVKVPVSVKEVKDKLLSEFVNDTRVVESLNKTFNERDKIEKVTLRRVNL